MLNMIFPIIKNVSSSTFHKKKLRLSLREFKKILPNTYIYESILITIYMNANIMTTQIFNLIKYVLRGHWRSQKVNFMIKIPFSLNIFFPNYNLDIRSYWQLLSLFYFLTHKCKTYPLFVANSPIYFFKIIKYYPTTLDTLQFTIISIYKEI